MLSGHNEKQLGQIPSYNPITRGSNDSEQLPSGQNIYIYKVYRKSPLEFITYYGYGAEILQIFDHELVI
jgi:hypothetical protein